MTSAVPHVAIVDDEEPVRRGLERLLRSSGFTAESFASGAAFIASLAVHHPDCLLLDLHMPVMDGFALLDHLAAAGVTVPVIVITGHDRQEYRDRAERSGVAAYLRKPLDGQVLTDAIRESLVGA